MSGRLKSRRPRRLSAITTLALGVVMLTAGSAEASSEYSNAGLVFGCNGGVCFNFKYDASWNAVQANSEGQHYWSVTKIRPVAQSSAGTLSAINTAGLRLQAGISAFAVKFSRDRADDHPADREL